MWAMTGGKSKHIGFNMLQFSHKGLAGVCWPSFWVMMGHAHQSVFAEILPETAAS